MEEVKEAIFMNEVEKLETLLRSSEGPKYMSTMFDDARGYNKIMDAKITLLHYCVYCDSYECAELILELGGKKEALSGGANTPRQVAERLFNDPMMDLFDQWQPKNTANNAAVRPTGTEEEEMSSIAIAFNNRHLSPATSPREQQPSGDPPHRRGQPQPHRDPPRRGQPQSQPHRDPLMNSPGTIFQRRTSNNVTLPPPSPRSSNSEPPEWSDNTTTIGNRGQRRKEKEVKVGGAVPAGIERTHGAHSGGVFAGMESQSSPTKKRSTTPQLIGKSTKEIIPHYPRKLLKRLLLDCDKSGDFSLPSTSHSVKMHRFIVEMRCPGLLENTNAFCEATTSAVQRLCNFLYLDVCDSLDSVPIAEIFEMWGMAIDFQLFRLESFIRQFVRNDQRMDNVLEYAICMQEFDLFTEYGSTLSFVRAHSRELKPQLMKNKALAMTLLKTDPNEYPQLPVDIVPSTIESTFSNFCRKYHDFTLTVTDCNEEVGEVNVVKAIVISASGFWRAFFEKVLNEDNDATSAPHRTPLPLSALKSVISYLHSGSMSFLRSDLVIVLYHLLYFKLLADLEKLLKDYFIRNLSSKSLSAAEQVVVQQWISGLSNEQKRKLRNSPVLKYLSKGTRDSLEWENEDQKRLTDVISSSQVVQDLQEQVRMLTERVVELERLVTISGLAEG